MTRQRYANLIEQGSAVVLHGVNYRIAYEAQIANHGKIIRKYSLGDPTFVEAAISLIVSGLVGNAAYDAVKSTLKKIYAQLKKRRLKPRTSSSDRGLCSQDVDLVYKLIGNDPEYAKTFFEYTEDYVKRHRLLGYPVGHALGDESAIDRLSDSCKNDPSIFVFASGSGKRFHRKDCKLLRPPIRRIRIKNAYLMPLTPCQRCKPI